MFWQREDFQAREDVQMEIDYLNKEASALEAGTTKPPFGLSVGDRLDDIDGMIEDLEDKLDELRG